MQIEIRSAQGSTILEYNHPVRLSTVFADHGIPVEMPCGGKQRCLKCRVKATGYLSPLSPKEEELLTKEEKRAGIRYACMAEAVGDVCVELKTERRDDRILLQGDMPEFTRKPWGTGLGVAVDIGTTTVAAYLYSLHDCLLLDTDTQRNPQSVFGADVISRIEKSMAGESGGLAAAIRSCVVQLMTAMCRRQERRMDEIDCVVLTGNTAMLYLLCGQNPSSIASAPFEQDCYFGEFLPPCALQLPISSQGRVYLPRCISAYVGGDITTALMAGGFNDHGKPADLPTMLLVDIGTNGEMALFHDGRILCCSTAAGPAFEGAGIYRGVNAVNGAISKVKYENGAFRCQVIGGGEATGICGSGIVDAVASMLDAGIIDETGLLLEEGHPFEENMTEADGTVAFRIPGTQIEITQKDIRAVQLAKSAICAGMLTLMAEAEIQPESVLSLRIAGGFGTFIDVHSAERIGLIPQGFAVKAKAIGNAAGSGASMLLQSYELLRDSEELAKDAQTVELSSSAQFMDAYVGCMMFE